MTLKWLIYYIINALHFANGKERHRILIAVADIAWTYTDPTPTFRKIKNYLSFYASKVDACYVNGEKVMAQDGDFYGGWITKHLVGPFKGGQGTAGW